MSSIRCPLFDAAMISRHETATVSGDQALLYFELDEMASRVARNLKRAGVSSGHRVAIFLENSWQLQAVLFGCWRAGAVACLLNTRLPRNAVLDQLRQLAAPFLIARVAQPLDESLRHVRILPPDELLIYREAGADEVEGWPLQLDAPATILFTSGSSGAPKAAVHTIANHYYSARGANQNVRLASRDCWLLSLPVYHVGGIGILFRCVMAGARVAIPEAGERIEQAQERYGVTHLSLVPTQLYRLVQAPSLPESFSKVKALLLGGAEFPPALLEEARKRRWPVVTSYGLTEMASQVCAMPPTAPPAKRGTSGRVLNYREIRIDPAGEIQVRGPTLFLGYWADGRVTRPQDTDGWFSTGDLGVMDEEGYLTVVGRKDNLFISGGENIQPEEIEQHLGRMPEIEAVLVAPRPDAEFGARPLAFVRWRGAPLPETELRRRLEQVLPRFKIPVEFRAWPFAETDGKLDRKLARQLAKEDR